MDLNDPIESQIKAYNYFVKQLARAFEPLKKIQKQMKDEEKE